MRIAVLTLVGAIGFAVSAMSANAAPVAPATPQASNIAPVAGSCEWRSHSDRWDRRSWHHRHYGPHAGWRQPWRGYSGGGWSSPSDHVANQLNRQQLGHMYGY